MIDFWGMSEAKCSFGTPKKEEIRHPKMRLESCLNLSELGTGGAMILRMCFRIESVSK